ncbi:uncharacterized protein V6R79_007282 [Siganus canaliculatus]
MDMYGIQYLASVWLITHAGLVCSEIQFLERHEGESVVFPCVVDQSQPSPFGVYLMRRWLQHSEVLFKLTNSDFYTDNDDVRNRTSVSGDPSSHSVNVTLSHLKGSDTDRYHCEFMVENRGAEDLRLSGKTEFFLLVNADAPASVDIRLVEACAGDSATLPCLPPNGEGLAVEGVSLKRKKGRAPVEVLYHSKRHRGSSLPSQSSSSSSSSGFPVERLHLYSVPGPRGITYNLTLQQLQPEDSALYSCQLLLRGRPDSSSSLGRHVFFLSVQGGQCGCSSYSTLLYALSSAVAILFLTLLLGCVVFYRGKSRRGAKSHTQAPIYEEMAGVHSPTRKVTTRHLEEMEFLEYRNCPAKKPCSENHYEIPSGALHPRREA